MVGGCGIGVTIKGGIHQGDLCSDGIVLYREYGGGSTNLYM